MKRFLSLIIAIFILSIGLISFNSCSNGKNPLDVDVSDISLNVKIERFDLELQEVDSSYNEIDKLYDKYGEFFNVYNNEIIQIGGLENSSYLIYLQTFLNDYAVIEASKEVDRTFDNCNELNEEITNGFKHLLYYYPKAKIPRVISFVAGFNQSIVIIDGFIGIGLDKYLGQNCKLYDMLGIPEYAKFEMNKDQIPVDIMTAWARDKYVFEAAEESLINYMIYNGKILYFIDAMFPEFDEARKNKYTESQIAFCYEFERDIWTALVENKLLFVTDYLTIKKFVESAPFTHQFGPDSPPRIANWIGLQIVRHYVKNNDVSFIDLMNETDYNKILNLSKYNPKYN